MLLGASGARSTDATTCQRCDATATAVMPWPFGASGARGCEDLGPRSYQEVNYCTRGTRIVPGALSAEPSGVRGTERIITGA
jgi:hypothetical protein